MEKPADAKLDAIRGRTSKRIVSGLIALLIALFMTLLAVIFFGDMTLLIGHFLGTLSNENYKIETIRLIGWAISGVFVAIGLAVLSQRAEAQAKSAEAQAKSAETQAKSAETQAKSAEAQAKSAEAQAKSTQAQVENNKLVEKGHMQERFKTATEHLGHDNASVRISAFYEFLHLIKDNGEEYRKSVLDILYAHMRTTTADFAKRKDAEEKGEQIKPSEEIQGLLDVLFKSQDIDRSDIKINLQRVYLSGADLTDGDLSGADLSKADLSGADLSKVDLSGANLSWADLSKAKLPKANLSGARLPEANLSEARLPEANLSRVNLSGADLSGARLPKANLFGARLSEANLSGADLSEANLSGAYLYKANLSGVIWYGVNLSETRFLRVNLSGAKLFGVNLSGAKLYETDLSGAMLYEANLSEASSYKTDLSGADLSSADLSGADLSDADLSKARLEGAFYTNETQFPRWLKLPLFELDNDDNMKIPKGFVAPEKPKEPEDDE